MNYLLDTCVISELVAKSPNEKVVGWVRSIPEDSLYMSVITIGEIKKGIERLSESKRKHDLNAWLNDELLERFKNRLSVLDVAVLSEWGRLVARLESEGKMMPAIDSLIAATALLNGFTLVTRNVADFAATGVEVLNPWT